VSLGNIYLNIIKKYSITQNLAVFSTWVWMLNMAGHFILK